MAKEQMAASNNVEVARAVYAAYVEKDRAAIERLIAEDFHFTSPLDNRLDRVTYFERCWPNSEWIKSFDFLNLVPDHDRVFATYEGHTVTGNGFRNTEILTVREGQLVEAEVYFGWSIPHKAEPGGFVAQEDQQRTQAPIAKTGMLIRRPAADVFDAFIDPEITTKFWFTKSSGPLEVGKKVKWEWEMYDHSTEVTPQIIEPNQRIVIEWQGYSGPSTVEWKFAPVTDDTTFVSVSESGWTGTPDELVKYATESGQGFTWTLAGLKAFLEHGIQLNLVADRFPKGKTEPFPDE